MEEVSGMREGEEMGAFPCGHCLSASCSMNSQISLVVTVCLFCCVVLQVSVLLGNWQQVLNYYSKAESTHEMTEVNNFYTYMY